MSLRKIVQDRYLATTWPELVSRVSGFVGQNDLERTHFKEVIMEKVFIPAGNNLLAGKEPIRPNCAIVEPINENNFDRTLARCKKLWSARIGIGFDLSTAVDPLNILKKLSQENAAIKFDHRPQRGNMAVLKADHLRILDFINLKRTDKSIYNFNLSVAIDSHKETPSSLMKEMAASAHACGDPGIIFLDRLQGITGATYADMELINDRIGHVHTTVPCGEQPLYSDECCSLGSINLAASSLWTPAMELKEEVFIDAVKTGVRFLDQTLDLMDIPDDQMKFMATYTRRIGLGVMGWADLLAMHQVKYGSEESYQLGHRLGNLFRKTVHQASVELGQEKGIAPVLKGTTLKRRNMMISCCPPTGGITLLTENQGFSIEPFFSEVSSIRADTHLKMQLLWQSYMDNCVSKTVNLPTSATVSDVEEVWHQANFMGLKSITVYRDGSHLNQPLQIGDCPKGSCSI